MKKLSLKKLTVKKLAVRTGVKAGRMWTQHNRVLVRRRIAS